MSSNPVISKTPSQKSKAKLDRSEWVNNIFHADLSDAFEGEDYWLYAAGKRYPLIKHTKESLAKVRETAPHLAKVPDHKLTHYTKEVVLLPHDRVMRIHIKHSLKTIDSMEGESAAHHAFIHIPPKQYRPSSKVKKEGITHRVQDGSDPVQPPSGAIPPNPYYNKTIHQYTLDYISTAKAFIFHHGDLFTHDPDSAQIIFDYMDETQNAAIYSLISNSSPDNMGLADKMEYYGIPTDNATGVQGTGWANQTAQLVYPRETDANGNFILDADGNYVYSTTNPTTYYRQEPIAEVIEYAGTVMTQMMIATKNDVELQNIKWTQEQGASVDSSTTNMEELATLLLQDDQWNAASTKSGFNDGLQVTVSVANSELKQVELDVQNSFIRYLGIYVSFFDAEGNVIDLDNCMTINGNSNQKWWPNNSDWSYKTSTLGSDLGMETSTLRYLTYISPINTIMAVPCAPNGEATLYITFPDNATKAVVYGCGIGTGQNNYPTACIIGGVMTGICNLAMPSFLLGLAVAAQSYKPLYDILNNDSVIKGMVGAGVVYFGGMFTASAVNKQMDWGSFSTLSQILFTTGCSKALKWAEEQIVEGELEEEIPFSGWIMVAINVATTLAQLAETIVEVASSPWQIENTIATTITSQITVHPDPRHGAWPEIPNGDTGTIVAKIIYKDESRPVLSQSITISNADLSGGNPITFSFPNNTLGGEVKFDVDFYINDWLSGKAYTPFIDNNEANAAEVTLYLMQIPVPLTADSVYQHTSMLVYQNDDFAWMDTASIPTGTIANADNSNTDSANAISEWVGLALSQRFAGIGMSWRSYGTGLTDASTKEGNSQLYAFQNVNIPNDGMDNAKFTNYGFTGQSMLVYDVYPPSFEMNNGNWVLDSNGQPVPDPNSVNLGDYYLDPRKANNSLVVTDTSDGDGGYHLRKISITGSSDFDVNTANPPSYGRFPYFPDHICIHPSGHVVGISQQYRKVMILKLSATGEADANLPLARDFAGTAQEANRPGLLFNPIAVSCSYDGTILILDSISSSTQKETRIQAFDLLGRPVNTFFDALGNPSAFLDLPTDVTYLDMVALGNKKMTYMYVLYYENDGSKVTDYKVAIYQYGETAPKTNPLVTTDTVPASRIQVDMWHTMYTLNYDMITDGNGNPSGPKDPNNAYIGKYGRTIPSVSSWLPPVPDSES